MGKAEKLIRENETLIRALAEEKGYAGLRDYAIANGLDSASGFSNFKKQLLSILDIDYNALRAATAAPAPTLLTQANLKERGWTLGLIKRHLGEPDVLKDNPVYRSAAPLKLYSLARVEAIEPTLDLERRKAGAAQRSAAALKAVQTKRENLLIACRGMHVGVNVLGAEVVLNRAIKSYNSRQDELEFERGYFGGKASLASDPLFLERIQVNYIRHALTHYDEYLEELAGKVGVSDGVAEIRRKVYKTISKAYPHLADECARQLKARLAELSQSRSSRL